MKLLYGKEYRLWQTLRAEYARVTAELEGSERMNQTFAGTIRQLMEDMKYYRERADRASDNLLLIRGVPGIRPEIPTPEEHPFQEDEAEVEALRKRIIENPTAAWD